MRTQLSMNLRNQSKTSARNLRKAQRETDPIVIRFETTAGKLVAVRLSQLSPELRNELDRLGEFNDED